MIASGMKLEALDAQPTCGGGLRRSARGGNAGMAKSGTAPDFAAARNDARDGFIRATDTLRAIRLSHFVTADAR
jgi:hypothetical protein